MIARVGRQIIALATVLLATSAQALDLEEYPDVKTFIQTFSQQYQYPEAKLRAIFAQIRVRQETIQAIERPREAIPYYEYRKQFLTDAHIQRGEKFWSQHASALAKARKQYGVAPEIIVAILGVETQYGRNKGDYLVADSLATLWLHHLPRADFFRHEMEEFLLLARELGVDPMSIKGSYAGAIGMPQFIPSSYRRYAVDFDGDGKRDLINNPNDIIGSVANFLRVHGWESGSAPMDDVDLHGTLYFWIERLGIKPSLNVEVLQQYGIMPHTEVPGTQRAALISFEGESGPIYRIGYNNFYVVTRYNRSKRYAMAVVELADRLRRNREEPS